MSVQTEDHSVTITIESKARETLKKIDLEPRKLVRDQHLDAILSREITIIKNIKPYNVLDWVPESESEDVRLTCCVSDYGYFFQNYIFFLEILVFQNGGKQVCTHVQHVFLFFKKPGMPKETIFQALFKRGKFLSPSEQTVESFSDWRRNIQPWPHSVFVY